MTPEDIEAGMQAMMEKDPPKELTAEERKDEITSSISIMREGTIERLAEFEGMARYAGAGSAKIVRNGDRYKLVLGEDFSVTAGPSLVVLASNHLNPGTRKELELADMTEVGRLKTFEGLQTFDLPEGFDVSTVKSIVIYCEPFQTVFAVASIH